MRADQKVIRTDLDALRTNQNVMRAELKGDLATLREEVKAQISTSQTRMILWTVGTMITLAGLAFSIAKFIH